MKTEVILRCSLAALFFLLQSKAVSSLGCYICDSKLDLRCLDKQLPDEMKMNCSRPGDTSKYNVCRTTILHIEFPNGGVPPDNRTVRSCALQHSPPPGRCYHNAGFGGSQKVCSCKEDYCNSSGSHYANLTVLVSTLALIYYNVFRS